jgi:hypothetical protein
VIKNGIQEDRIQGVRIQEKRGRRKAKERVIEEVPKVKTHLTKTRKWEKGKEGHLS